MGISKMHQCLKGIAERNKNSSMTGSSTHEGINWTEHNQKCDCHIKLLSEQILSNNLNSNVIVTLLTYHNWPLHPSAKNLKITTFATLWQSIRGLCILNRYLFIYIGDIFKVAHCVSDLLRIHTKIFLLVVLQAVGLCFWRWPMFDCLFSWKWALGVFWKTVYFSLLVHMNCTHVKWVYIQIIYYNKWSKWCLCFVWVFRLFS